MNYAPNALFAVYNVNISRVPIFTEHQKLNTMQVEPHLLDIIDLLHGPLYWWPQTLFSGFPASVQFTISTTQVATARSIQLEKSVTTDNWCDDRQHSFILHRTGNVWW